MSVMNDIDNGKAFDWGRTSSDYAKYRDIYPQKFYEKIHSLVICTSGQNVLDIGTGTGVIPRNMYHYGARFTGTDISENQIAQAKMLADEEVAAFEREHLSLLEKIAPEEFDILHYCAISVLEKR